MNKELDKVELIKPLLLEMCSTSSMEDHLFFWILPQTWFVSPLICQGGRSGQSEACWACAGPPVAACAVYASGGPWEHCGLKGNVSLNSGLGPFNKLRCCACFRSFLVLPSTLDPNRNQRRYRVLVYIFKKEILIAIYNACYQWCIQMIDYKLK